MIHPKKISLWIRALLALVVVAALAYLRLRSPWNAVMPFGYMVPVVIIAWLRSRAILWTAVAGLMATMILKQLLPGEASNPRPVTLYALGSWSGTLIIVVNLTVLAGLCHLWIASLDRIETQNAQLGAANAELAARDEKILQTNQELRSQTVELERHSQETAQLLTEVGARTNAIRDGASN